MEIKIISQEVSLDEVKTIAKSNYGDMVKAVVDVKRKIMALGGELHADAEAELLKNGSDQEDLWGINIYPDNARDQIIVFSSLINIRPKAGNKSIIIEIPAVKEAIVEIINHLIRE